MSTPQNPFNPTDRMLRQFAGLWVVFFGAFAAIQEFQRDRHTLAVVLAVLAATVGPLGLIRPAMIRPIFIGWMTLAYPIGWLVSRVVLGAIFYGLFTPLGYLFRLIGRDVLWRKARPSAASYWHTKTASANKAHYFRQF